MLLDTSGLLAYQYASEPNHEAAVTLFERARQTLTHSYILAEFVALAHARKLSRRAALAFVIDLLEFPEGEVVWVGEALHWEAVLLLQARADKNYSLCDAVSFVLMKRRGITEALTTDHHFAQEGFQRLLSH